MSGSGGVSVRAGPSARPTGRRLAQRQAQRRYLRRHRHGEDPEPAELGGAWMCGGCGQLRWPTPRDHGPHRTHEAMTTVHPACSHCGDQAWIDLGRPSNALALRNREDDDARAAESTRGRATALGLGGVLVGGFLGLVGGGGLALTVATAGLCGLLAVLVTVRRDRTAAFEPRYALPARWAMALPPATAPDALVQGPAIATGERLRAPLSGRCCVAYEVGVRRDDDATAPPLTWALLEQKLAALTVDGHVIDLHHTHLELPRRRLDPDVAASLDEAARAYLRQRGIRGELASLVLFESIVEPGAEVRVAIAKSGSILRIAAGSATLPAARVIADP